MSGLSFDQLASQPEHWFQLASQLFCAAEACLNAVPALSRQRNPNANYDKALGHMGGGMLMLAFAVENAFKGLAIERGSNFYSFKNGHLIWKGGWRGHDLVSMAADLVLALDAHEREALLRLTIFGRWSGRYPIPSNEEFYQSEHSSRRFRLSDIEFAQRLIAQCKALAGFDPVTGWPRRN